MGYQKTAKDLAWDRERQKLKSEIAQWIKVCADKTNTINHYKKEKQRLEDRVSDLENAITELTKGEMTPDEVMAKMRKQSELADLMKVMVNGARGMF